MQKIIIMAAAVLALLSPGASAFKTDVYTSGRDGYAYYRIPAIIKAADGSLLAFCEGRVKSRSDRGDIDLLVKRSTDGGKTWGSAILVWDDANNT